MRRALLFFLLPTVAVMHAVAADRPSKEPVCVQASSIENWRVWTARGVSIDVRTPNNTQATLVVKFLRECFPRWPFKTMRIEARGACLAPGDTMIFNFPPSEGSEPSKTEGRCVVKMIGSPVPPQPEEPPTCVYEPSPDGRGPVTERCY